MKKRKTIYLIGILFFPFLIFGQNVKSELKIELSKIDSIVKLTNETQKNYSEGIIEGPIVHKSIFRKNGAWEAYFLYKNENENPPLRIIYNEAENKTYQSFEFYYQNGELIFAKLIVKFYRGKMKNQSIEKKYYFKKSELIFESKSELEKYNSEYITQTEKNTREIIYE